MATAAAIGIDLGTTFCCVAVRGREGRIEIVPNDMGNRTTPSYVSFTDDGRRLAGEAARERARSHPSRTVYDVKRMFGRRTDDRELLRDRTAWPFEVDTSDETAGPLVVIGDRRMRPEEVSGVLLAHLRQTAETYLGRKVSDAVVTVPAYFNDAARRATIDAAAIAGLNVLRILNEPTAAAIAYGLQCDRRGERTVLVFDCGGGTFDVTLLTLEDGLFQVIATGGDPHLGGEDFDRRLFEHVLPAESRTSCSLRGLERLRDACERAKRALTSTSVATIEVDRLWDDGRDFVKTVTRSKFETLCDDLFRRCLTIVDGVLLDADASIRDVDDVVLVGGSTRIPALQRMLSDHFGGKELCRSLHPDEAVAHGAAVQAAMLSGADASDGIVLLLDVCPLSISVETAGGVSTVMIPRNTTVPVRKTRRFTTHENDQTDVEIKVFEGERTFARDNQLLGTFELAGIPAAPRGTAQIDVELALDADGVLQVTATETVSGRTQSVVIKNDAGRMSRADVEARLAEARRYADQDREDRARLEALDALEDALRLFESNETLEWLERDGRANATARELRERRDELVRKKNRAVDNDQPSSSL